jgi:hypothetical protein
MIHDVPTSGRINSGSIATAARRMPAPSGSSRRSTRTSASSARYRAIALSTAITR